MLLDELLKIFGTIALIGVSGLIICAAIRGILLLWGKG